MREAVCLDLREILLYARIRTFSQHVTVMGEGVHPFQFTRNDAAGAEYDDVNIFLGQPGEDGGIKEPVARA